MNENRAMSKTEPSDASAGQDAKLGQSSVSSTERYPNLTLLESGQNPGELLRTAREKAGYSLSDVSAQTKINERQLEAIESGDVGRLPPETFAKAFIKSYCKALKVDHVPVIMSFGFSENNTQTKAPNAAHANAAARIEPLESKMPDSSKRLSTLNFDQKTGKKSLSYGIVLAAVALMAVFYIPVFMSNQEAKTDNAEPANSNEPSSFVAATSEDQTESTADDTVTEFLPLQLDSPLSSGDMAVFPALKQPSDSATASQAELKTSSSTTDSVDTPAVSADTPVSKASPAVSAPGIAAAPQGSLRFNFQEPSWVTVRDANNNVLISQLNDGGSNLEVRGQAPFKLIVGNAKAVSVTSNGKTVDLSSSSIRDGVARVTAP